MAYLLIALGVFLIAVGIAYFKEATKQHHNYYR
jgi:hypothetical protein